MIKSNNPHLAGGEKHCILNIEIPLQIVMKSTFLRFLCFVFSVIDQPKSKAGTLPLQPVTVPSMPGRWLSTWVHHAVHLGYGWFITDGINAVHKVPHILKIPKMDGIYGTFIKYPKMDKNEWFMMEHPT